MVRCPNCNHELKQMKGKVKFGVQLTNHTPKDQTKNSVKCFFVGRTDPAETIKSNRRLKNGNN